jgi:hypothetical protein
MRWNFPDSITTSFKDLINSPRLLNSIMVVEPNPDLKTDPDALESARVLNSIRVSHLLDGFVMPIGERLLPCYDPYEAYPAELINNRRISARRCTGTSTVHISSQSNHRILASLSSSGSVNESRSLVRQTLAE